MRISVNSCQPCCKNASGLKKTAGRWLPPVRFIVFYFLFVLERGIQKRSVYHRSRAWRLRNVAFPIVPAPGGSETLRFP
jgi:hypothetical protein